MKCFLGLADSRDVKAEVRMIEQKARQCPNEYFKLTRRPPKENKQRMSKLEETFKGLAKIAVNDGDEETYRLLHARLLQNKREIQVMIAEKTGSTPSVAATSDSANYPEPPLQQTRNRKARVAANSINSSALSRSARTAGGRGRGRARGGRGQGGRGRSGRGRGGRGPGGGGEDKQDKQGAQAAGDGAEAEAESVVVV